VHSLLLPSPQVRLGSREVFGSDGQQEYSDPRASSRYEAKYQAFKMRKDILLNELHDEKAKTLDKILKKKRSLKSGPCYSHGSSAFLTHPTLHLFPPPPLFLSFSAEAHLLEERRNVEEKIQLLREEIDLIDTHLQEQRTKIAEVEELESSSRSNVALLEKSVSDIEDEMEKLNILASQGGARR
jgi:hypothetical protein